MLFAVIFVLSNPALRTRLFYMEDRQLNMKVALDYLRDRPLLGYGGNTLDILYIYDPSPLVDKDLAHTHNTILELLVRYGILGLISFGFMLWCGLRKIRNPDAIFALLLFWGLSMLQIYFRNFIFLMIIMLLIKRYSPKSEQNILQIDISLFAQKLLQKIKRIKGTFGT